MTIFTGSVHGTEARKELAPTGHPEMKVIGQAVGEDSALFPQAEDHQRQVEHALQRVVAGKHDGAVGGNVVESVKLRTGKQPPRREQRLGECKTCGRWFADNLDGFVSHGADI